MLSYNMSNTSVCINIASLVNICLTKLRQLNVDLMPYLRWESIHENYIKMPYCNRCKMYIEGDFTNVNLSGSEWKIYYHDRVYHNQDLPRIARECKAEAKYNYEYKFNNLPRNICCLRCNEYFHTEYPCEYWSGIMANTYFYGFNGFYYSLRSGYGSEWDGESFILIIDRISNNSLSYKILQKLKSAKRRMQTYAVTPGFKEIPGTLVKLCIPIQSHLINHYNNYIQEVNAIICDECVREMLKLGELRYIPGRHQCEFLCEVCRVFYTHNQPHYNVISTDNKKDYIIIKAWREYYDGTTKEDVAYHPNNSYNWCQYGCRICASCISTLQAKGYISKN